MRIFEEDPKLLGTAAEQAPDRLRNLTVPVRSLPRGLWDPGVRAGEQPLAMLVLEGTINLETRLFGRTATEILGPGDLLSISEEAEPGPLPHESRLRVMVPSRIAVLDADFRSILHRIPGVADELMRRTRESARGLRRQQAIAGIPNTAQRLLMLLWQLADRWGTPTKDGVVLEIRLTHATLASLAHCARETVGRALGEFRKSELVSVDSDGYLVLHGLPPVELEHLEAAVTTISELELGPKT